MLSPNTFAALLLATTTTSVTLVSTTETGVSLRDNPDAGLVRIEIDGSLFAEYHYKNTSRPCTEQN
jgi:hypothetical protein